MELYQRQQFDFLLMTATERFVERIVQRNEGAENALQRLQTNPRGEGIWLDEYVKALFQDFLLNNTAGACFILQALEKRVSPTSVEPTIERLLNDLAHLTFAELLREKVIEALEQASMYG